MKKVKITFDAECNGKTKHIKYDLEVNTSSTESCKTANASYYLKDLAVLIIIFVT